MVHQPEDTRPQLCRNRLRDEGQAYPRSGCAVCGNGGLMGCPHERRPSPPTTGSGVKPPPQPSAEVMVRVALEMSSRVVAAVEAERDAARASLATAEARAAQLQAEVEALKGSASSYSAALTAMKLGASCRRQAWKPGKTVRIVMPQAPALSYLAIVYDDGRQAPWTPTRCDQLEDDWLITRPEQEVAIV